MFIQQVKKQETVPKGIAVYYLLNNLGEVKQ
jgi:hypothetical protein